MKYDLYSFVDPQQATRRRCSVRSWFLREWCFFRVVWGHFRIRVMLLLTILLGGAVLFMFFEPEKQHSFIHGVYCSWFLIFGQPPEEFPQSRVLQLLFFIIPILGLSVVLESIVGLALVLRDRQLYERGWCIMMASSMSDHIVLVGMGKLGFHTFQLLRQLNEPVVVIERDSQNQFLEEVRRDGSPLLIGDARREALLQDANIASAKSIIVATDDDLANLEVALDARRLAPNVRVVMRVFDQNMADKIREGFNIHIAMSQSARSAPAYATAAIDRSIINSFIVDEQLVVMQRWEVHDEGPLCGKTIGDLMAEYGFVVVKRRSVGQGQVLFPPPHVRLEPGDSLVVQGPFRKLAELRAKDIHLAATGIQQQPALGF